EQSLILQELNFSRLKIAAEEDAAAALDATKKQYGTDADYRAALLRYHISESDVLDHLLAGVRSLRFTDLRFRPEIEITDDDLRDAYDQLTASARAKGDAKIPAFDDSRDDLTKLLVAQRLTQALDRWLGSQRTQTEILYREAVFR